MNTSVAVTSLVCGLAIVGEGLFMGRKGAQFMKSLKQPDFAPPAWAWGIIGAAYYGICFFVLFRLLSLYTLESAAFLLLILFMAANTFWNFIYFRLRNLRLVFWYSVVYSALAVVLLFALFQSERYSALAFSIYVAYLPYALTIFYRTWKLNPASLVEDVKRSRI